FLAAHIILARLLHAWHRRHFRDGDIPPRLVAADTLPPVGFDHDAEWPASVRLCREDSVRQFVAVGRTDRHRAHAGGVGGKVEAQRFAIKLAGLAADAEFCAEAIAADRLRQAANAGITV